jgi:hypothetical protein
MNLNKNILQLEQVNNKILNFKKYLNPQDSLIWKNCNNLIISINSKINKIVFLNSQNLKIKISSLISGIDIEKCNNFNLSISKNKKINSIYIYKSNINLKLTKNQLKNIKITNENSKINYIFV